MNPGALRRFLGKYGVEAFTIEQVCEASNHLLEDLERYFIVKFGTFASTGHGYNETLGGHGNLGHIVSEETKRKMSLSQKGKSHIGHPCSPETRAKIAEAHTGRVHGPHSEAHKAKMSLALKGIKRGAVTAEHRAHLSESHKGKGHPSSEETNAKISASKRARDLANPGSHQPPETIAKRVAVLRGQTRSIEQREKMSIAARKRGTAWAGLQAVHKLEPPIF